jgi:twitching motility protein PilT
MSTLEKVRGYLAKMVEQGGSDLHIKANSKIYSRVQGKVIPFSDEEFSAEDIDQFARDLLKDRYQEFVDKKELDLVYVYSEDLRFRVNMFFQMDGISGVFRVVPVKILTVDQLNLPAVVHKFTDAERGLVLVTGVTGSGKSTTLAALISEINHTKHKHILTIEDPIEFVHKSAKSIINQRSIGQDTFSFGNALRAALREDPDIILVGEMRDMETIEIALHAAETGHLVFSTLHTLDAKETVNRIISTFPVEEQNRIRITLASVLKGVISQRLIPTIDKKRAAALEVLFATPRIEQLIMENRDNELRDTMEEGKEIYGSQTFDQALLDLFQAGRISKEDAFANATSASDLKLKMEGMQANMSSKDGEMKRQEEFREDEIFALKT